LLATIKTFLAYAVEQDVILVSPAAAIRPPAPQTARERTLTDDELGAVLEACAGLGEYGAIVRLLILTGQRRSEVAEMRWSEVDMTGRVWNIPAARCKNGRAHSVPLSAQAIDCVRWLCPALGELSGPVFAPQSFSRCKGELDAELKAGTGIQLPPWVLHDLRRTAASGMAGLGVQLPVIEKVLNHQSGSFRGVCGVYQRHSFSAEKRSALELWGAHVVTLEPSAVALSKAA
jgi:integrase